MILFLLDLFDVEGKHLLLRMAGAALLSFLLVIALGPRMIRYLLRRKIGDRPEFDHADLNDLTRHKSNTPTMGGALIVIAIMASILVFGDVFGPNGNMYVRMSLLALVWLGALGGIDDWLKLNKAAGKSSRDGLKSWEKMLFQLGLAVLLGLYTYRYGSQSDIDGTNPAHNLYIPFWAGYIVLSQLAYTVITVLTMVGFSNAVNLTDGMDGLAGGCVIIVTFVLLVLAELVGVVSYSQLFNLPLVYGSVEMTIVCTSMIGACLGFLWYNAHPAQVFMGDTGSLPLGGLIGYTAVVTRQELLLLIAGGVFIMEAGSVMLQVGYFKMTRPAKGMKGRKIFRCAPLHHHFHLGGWAETKVVTRFWLLGIVFAALALASLKLRLGG
ncbi:MAG: phospho-N-acetylmuramoyl-pentapeptide-transferase [Planctomycetes bacterium]|jgi:phospho-N-acetylmuramoyl-pentapeptide-transferase|nr:phospho-N-acetylmuramoyl-pentapeptide-transferase [Planctomycetota bacterium]